MNEASVLDAGMGGTPDLSVIILTLNEEKNLPFALRSVSGWAKAVFILDSGSTDATVDIARSYGCQIASRPFDNYSAQRNYALQNLPIETEWVLFLDADEWLTKEIKREIGVLLARGPAENGFFMKRRVMWMGRWVRHGIYPTWILRLFRRKDGRCESRVVNEHLLVNGGTGYLNADFVHEDRKGIGDWIAKHNRYATLEAQVLISKAADDARRSLFRSQVERKRWLRLEVWERLPPVSRSFLYFFYRLILQAGFLDGMSGMTYHFLQAFWYPLLIDLKYIEARHAVRRDVPGTGAQTPGANDAASKMGSLERRG